MAMLRVTRMSGEELTRVPLTELSDVKSLKQRLKEQHGLPPWFRQRLLHDGNPLDDSVKLDSAMDLQVVVVGFNQATENQRNDLFDAADKGNLTKAGRQEHLVKVLEIPGVLCLPHLYKEGNLFEACRSKGCCSFRWTRMLDFTRSFRHR